MDQEQPDVREEKTGGFTLMQMIGVAFGAAVLIILAVGVVVFIGGCDSEECPSPTPCPPPPPPCDCPSLPPSPSPPPTPTPPVPEGEEIDGYFMRRFGAEDRDGAVNLITPEVVLNSLKYVQTGKVYHLSVETTTETPAMSPRTYKPFLQVMATGENTPLTPDGDRYLEDMAYHSIGVGTHIDGFAHWTRDWKSYNAVPQSEFMDQGLVKELGAGNIKPIVTRGVILDFVSFLCENGGYGGVLPCEDGHLPPSHMIMREDIENALEAFDIAPLGAGDVLLIHTGYGSLIGSPDESMFTASPPGLEVDGCEWLGSLGIVAVGADTFSLDVFPPPEGKPIYGCHPVLLNRYGAYILEYMKTHDLVEDGVKEFLFILGVPKLMGLVQANVAPLAIV